MAVLNKIRQRGLFLIIVIALALFSFILADLFKSGSAFGSNQDTIGIVNGENINRTEFMNKVDNVQRQLGPNGTSIQAMNRVWDTEVKKAIFATQCEELGLSIERDKMRDLLKTNFSSFPEFNNEDGIFDENKLNEFIANLKDISPTPSSLAGGQYQINYAQWIDTESNISTGAKEQAYYNLIKAGVNATLGEAEFEHLLESQTINIKYVQVPYTSIVDSLVEVSKANITNYINSNQKKFEVEASRNISFVEFKEIATPEDEQAIQQNLLKLREDKQIYNEETKETYTELGFDSTTEIERFVNANSDEKYNDDFIFKSKLASAFRDSIFNLNVGDYYGPYKENEAYKLTKVIDTKKLSDSVKVRHILIPFVGATRAAEDVTKNEEEAKKTADSILSAVKSRRSKFVDLLDLSSDKASNEKQGEIEFSSTSPMAQEFKDFSFNNKVGDIDVVKTSFGFHIIEILTQKEKERALKLATISQKTEPSEATIDNVYNTAANFEIALQDKDFQDAAKENNYTVKPVNNIKALEENIPGVGNQRSIVRWAFENDTEIGDYKRFSIPNFGFVVVQLTAIHDEGLMSVENVPATDISKIRNEKKAALIRKKIMATVIDDIAKNQGQTVKSASALNMKNPTISGAGLETKVVGVAFGLKEGQTSALIDGEKGVYVVEVTKVNDAVKLDNYQAIANRLGTARVNQVQSKVYDALKEASDIEDNRVTFY